MHALVDRQTVLLQENVRLRAACDERDRRVRELEEKARELHQRRRDVAKRIDDLIAQIDHLEAQIPAPEPR